MKILLVHSSYRHYGGEDKVFFQERDALRKQLGDRAVLEYHVGTKGLSAAAVFFQTIFPFTHYFAIYRLIKKHQVQLVHVHNFFPILSLAVFRAARNAGAFVVHTLHNYRWWCINGELYQQNLGICERCPSTGNAWHAFRFACYRSSRWQTLVGILLQYVTRKRLFDGSIDRFIVLSPFQQQWVIQQGLPPEKVVLKPNCIEQQQHAVVSSRSGFVFIGRLEPSKGVEGLLSVWKQMPSGVTLTLLGTGSLEESLKQTYQHDHRIHFLGMCSPTQVAQVLSQSLYALQTSLWYETFGLSILEAMQQGVPVIGYAIGTRPDFIEDGVNGFLCTPQTLLDTLLKAYHHQDYNRLAEKAQETAAQFGAEKIIAAQLQLYSSWIDAGRMPSEPSN